MSSVSVVIPAFNIGPFLARAVHSVLNQTHLPIEVLIIDNHSGDETLQIARELEAQYGQIIRVLQEPNRGAPHARNRGLREVKGTWIQFLDGDDLLLPRKIEYQLGYIDSGAGFITSPAVERAVDGRESEITVVNHIWKGLFLGGGGLGFTSSILWNTEAIRAVDGWNSSLKRHQEYDLMFRMLVAGFKGVIAPVAHTIKCKRSSGQISDIPYPDILVSSLALRSRILHHALSDPEMDLETLHYLFNKYFLRYTRLRVRRPDYAAQVKQRYFKKVITPAIKRKYPYIYLLQARCDLYAFYKQSKAVLGKRGLLGKLIGSKNVFLWLAITTHQLKGFLNICLE